MAVLELQLQLDPAEVRRRRLEGEAVATGRELLGEARAPVAVGLGARDDLLAAAQLDAHAAAWAPAFGVEHVGRERDAHPENFSATRRCSCAICSSSARASRPSRTTSSPATTSRSTRCGPLKTRPPTG